MGTEITPKHIILKKDYQYIKVSHLTGLKLLDIKDLLFDVDLLVIDFEIYYQYKQALVGFDKLIDLSMGTFKRNDENNTEQFLLFRYRKSHPDKFSKQEYK